MALPMRRFTLVTVIVLFVGIVIAAIFQLRAATSGHPRYCGPGQRTGCVLRPTPSPTPTP
jgi:hypothetical protein